MSLWLMRSGEKGCYEQDALKQGLAIVDWSKLGDLSRIEKKEDVRNALLKKYPSIPLTRISHWIPQVWYFCSEISIGDLLAMPIRNKKCFKIGEVIGNYKHISGGRQPYHHVRKTKWFEREILRADLDDDLRHSLNCHRTICAIRRERAEERVRGML
jgi:predicted Mrr-cat superfamily restriction endonuclease